MEKKRKVKEIKETGKKVKVRVIEKENIKRVERKEGRSFQTESSSDDRKERVLINDNRVVAVQTPAQVPAIEPRGRENLREEQRTTERLYSAQTGEETRRYAERPVSILTTTRIEQKGFFDGGNLNEVNLNQFREHVGNEQDMQQQYYHGIKEDERMVSKRRKELF